MAYHDVPGLGKRSFNDAKNEDGAGAEGDDDVGGVVDVAEYGGG